MRNRGNDSTSGGSAGRGRGNLNGQSGNVRTNTRLVVLPARLGFCLRSCGGCDSQLLSDRRFRACHNARYLTKRTSPARYAADELASLSLRAPPALDPGRLPSSGLNRSDQGTRVGGVRPASSTANNRSQQTPNRTGSPEGACSESAPRTTACCLCRRPTQRNALCPRSPPGTRYDQQTFALRYDARADPRATFRVPTERSPAQETKQARGTPESRAQQEVGTRQAERVGEKTRSVSVSVRRHRRVRPRVANAAAASAEADGGE